MLSLLTLVFLLVSISFMITPTISNYCKESQRQTTEILSTSIRSIWLWATEVSSTIGENQEELWHTLLLVLQITLLRRSSLATVIAKTAIGGVWARSCSNVRLDGHHSVLRMLTIPTERLSIGVNLCTSQMMFSWVLKRRIWSEGNIHWWLSWPHANAL